MELFSLILYGFVSLAMIVSCLREKGQFCQFPFWAGIISLGFFFTQAIGGLAHIEQFPKVAYVSGMNFATLCMLSLWVGFNLAYKRGPARPSWLSAGFNIERLFYAGVFFSIVGFFFQWKLSSLADELLMQSQWSGATIKYHFFASLFHFGLITLWILYLNQRKRLNVRVLAFLIPCLLLLVDAAVFHGRRGQMMNLCAYLVVGSWLVHRIAMPRWVLILVLACGLIWVNSVGVYRSIMRDKEKPLAERLAEAAQADYASASKKAMAESSIEFKNYINFRYMSAKRGRYDYGTWHWNRLVFNYVPAQLVGANVKRSLMINAGASDELAELTRQELGHATTTGATKTGFLDAFGSFGWFGFIKFGLIGWIMGVLYQRAMQGLFLGQLLYVYLLSDAMHTITHHTGRFLFSPWVYFFALAYPIFLWARERRTLEPR